MVDDLGARERQIMDAVYRLGQPGAREVLDALGEDLHYSTVRTMLNKLEGKGHLRRVPDGRRYRYVPTTSRGVTQRRTLRKVIRNLFDGSAARTVAALLDLDSQEFSREELEELSKRIESLQGKGQ